MFNLLSPLFVGRLNPFNNESNIKVSPVEVASEVYEEPACKTNLSSPSEPSEASTWRRRDLVSMATFRLFPNFDVKISQLFNKIYSKL